jgi:hypothetical protein
VAGINPQHQITALLSVDPESRYLGINPLKKRLKRPLKSILEAFLIF